MNGRAATPPAANSADTILAAWTRISAEEAQILYDGLAERRPGMISSKAAIGQLGAFASIEDIRVRLITALCRAAMDADALDYFYQAIIGRERAKERPKSELQEIRARIGAPVIPEAVLDRARGVIPTELLDVLTGFREAVGYVERIDGIRRDIIGTALLVRPDVVITCAHVAFEAPGAADGVFDTPRNVRIWFPRTAAGLQDAGLAKQNPVLAFSPANTIGRDQLDRLVTAATARQLDFALLRLDRAIDRVKPIPLSGKTVEVNGRQNFLIGFPGAKGSVFDIGLVTRVETMGGRLIHAINSVSGMSGGCLIDDTGVPIAIHEGSIPPADPDAAEGGRYPVENRAVLLHAVAADIESRSLAVPDRPAGLVMYEEALVTRLGRRGAQLLADAAAQAGWETLVASITAITPAGPWAAHPWFTDRRRAAIERWFAQAGAAPDSRVAFVNGPRGSGKTFMIDILKRIVPDVRTDLIRVTWVEGDTMLRALERQIEAAADLTGTRTADGHVRYETVPAIVAALARHGLAAATAGPRSQPLFIAIDAGDETGPVMEPATWIELVAALSRQPWARVLLCGLPDDLMIRVEDAVPLEVACEHFEIEHVRGRDIVAFLRRFGMGPDADAKPEAAEAAFDAPDMPHKSCPDLTTSMAALFAIGWHRGILPVNRDATP